MSDHVPVCPPVVSYTAALVGGFDGGRTDTGSEGLLTRIRAQRVAEQMKKEVADIIRTGVKDPRVGFATVTHVEVTNDLQHAKVYISVFGDQEQKQNTMDALQRAVGFIRGEASRRLRMRVAPEIQFKLDESGEYSAHIETVLRQIKPEPSTGGHGTGDHEA